MVLPYHLSVPTQLAGTTALGVRRRDGASGSTRSSRSGDRLFARAGPAPGPRRRARRAPTSCWSGVDGDGHDVWERLVERGVLVRDFSRWPRVEGCLRITVGTPGENDAFLAALREVLAGGCRLMGASEPGGRASAQHRETKETTIDLSFDVDGRGDASVVDRHPVLRPHARAARQARRLRPDDRREGRPRGRPAPHRRRRRDRARDGAAEALGDKGGVRRFASTLVPLDEALVQVALDLSGRPFLVYDVDPIAEWIGTFDPQLGEEFWKGFVDGGRHHAAPAHRSRGRTGTT